MIPTLNMNKIRSHTTVAVPAAGASGGAELNSSGSGSSGPRLTTGRQISPRPPYLGSPLETSSLPSAHLQRRAADVATVLDMNPLQCHSVGELQRKLIETAEWVVKLRHWYVHQLQERDAWYECRLRGLEDAFHAALTPATAARTAYATARADAAQTVTGCISAEHAAPSTIATRVAAGGASVSSAVAATVSVFAEKEVDSDTVLQNRRRAHKNSPATRAAAGPRNDKNPGMINFNQSSAVDTDLAVAGVANNADGGSRTPLRVGPPKRSEVVPIVHGRRTASVGAPSRQLLALEDRESPRISAVGIAVDRDESRPTLAERALAATVPIILDNGDNTSREPHNPSPLLHLRGRGAGGISLTPSATNKQVIGTPMTGTVGLRRDVQFATTPLSGRPSSANARLSTASAAAESSGRLSARAGGIGGRRDDAARSERNRYYLSLSRSISGSTKIGLSHFAQYLNASTSRDSAVTGAGTGSSATDGVASSPHEKAPRISPYLYIIRSGDSHSRNLKRRSASTGGSRRACPVYITRKAKASSAGLGVSGQHCKETGSSDASEQSSLRRFVRE
ncbi:hypothetical protein MNV84_00697 [Leishmania braziliensis]|nr:hypothetical protein MNV84_00697 [Leishmania braziliensis]